MGEPKRYILIPNTGRGLFTAWSRFSMGQFSDSFANWRDILVQRNSWQTMVGNWDVTLPTGGGLGTGPVWAIYYFNAINTASSSAQPTLVALFHVGGTVNPVGGTAVLARYDTNTVILSTTAPHELCFLTIKNRCFIAGATLTGGAVPTIVTKYPTATSYSWGKAGPTNNLAYTPYTNFTATGDRPQQKIYVNLAGSGTEISTTSGLNTISSAGAGSFNASGTGPPHPWNGKTLIVDNGAETYKINAITSATAGSLTTNATATRANVAYEVRYGQLSWTDQPPLYAYSYYNPTTGHSTNISPVMRVSEKNISNVAVYLTNIPLTNDPNYTRVILWRNAVLSAGGESTMLPLKLDSSYDSTGGTYTTATIVDGLINNNLVGTVAYVDNAGDDQLGEVIGIFRPPNDNDPPPANIRFMEYWNGSVWFTTSSEPWRLRYTRPPNPDLLGVAEESAPARLFIDAPSNDGLITGLRAVGGALLVCTDRFMYFVDGQSEGNFRLERVSARGGGVRHFAIDEHPGDTTKNESSALYISHDRRLWRHYPGGKLEDLGAPIQDKLDDAPLDGVSKPYIVRVVRKGKNWFCAVGILKSTTKDYYNFYFFDFDHLGWYDLAFTGGTNPGLSIESGFNYATGELFIEIGKNAGNVIYEVMAANVIAPIPKLTTQWLDMDDVLGKKTLQNIAFYVSDAAAAGWLCEVRFDGNDGGAYTTLAQTTGVVSSPRFRGPGIIYWSPRDVGVKQWHAIQLRITLPQPNLISNLHKVEINYTPITTGASGKPS